MKKIINFILVIGIVLTLVGCGNNKTISIGVVGTQEITIDGITYYNTGRKAGSIPDKSTIENLEFCSEVEPSISAYALIENGKLAHCLIDGQWYIFLKYPQQLAVNDSI